MSENHETRVRTHAADCWGWGPKHYECAVSQVERLRAAFEELLDALRQIADWPDGGNRYGQDKIKRFAQAAIDAAIDHATHVERDTVGYKLAKANKRGSE